MLGAAEGEAEDLAQFVEVLRGEAEQVVEQRLLLFEDEADATEEFADKTVEICQPVAEAGELGVAARGLAHGRQGFADPLDHRVELAALADDRRTAEPTPVV